MNAGSIDSASLINAVGGLVSYRSQNEWNKWTAQSIRAVTGHFILHDLLDITPTPSKTDCIIDSVPSGTLYFGYDKALSILRLSIGEVDPRMMTYDNNILYANALFKNWLKECRETDEIHDIVVATMKEPDYQHWAIWARREAWVDHTNRLNGLFNKNMIDDLSVALGHSKTEMETVWKRTKDIIQVKKWSRDEDLDKCFEIAEEAFIASAILRGRFHQLIAIENGSPYQYHPIRKHIVIKPKKGFRYEFSTSLKYLIEILVNSPWKEKHPIDRISLWADNISKVSKARREGRLRSLLNQQNELDEDDALKVALNIAKELKLRTYSQKNVDSINVSMIVGSTLAGGITNNPWVGVGLGALSMLDYYIGKNKSIAKRIAEELTLRDRPLGDLAKAQPGCLNLYEDQI